MPTGDGPMVSVGWVLATRPPGPQPPTVTELIEQGTHAERLGFDGVWVGESLIARPRPDALTLLSALAVTTTHCTLGTAVLLPALRHPVVLAHQLATLDALSRGRLIVGAGIGFPMPATEAEFTACGVVYQTRAARFDECIRAMRQLWAADRPISFRGRHVRFDDVELEPRPAQLGGPPIWFTGTGPRAVARTGRHGDGWLPYPPHPDQYRTAWDDIASVAAEAGRPAPTAALFATVNVDDDPERARQRLQTTIERQYQAPADVVAQIQATCAGTPDTVAAWLSAYLDAGVQHVVLRVADEDQTGSMERVAHLLTGLRAAQAR